MFQNFIIPKLSNIGLVTIGFQLRQDDGMIWHKMSENVKFALKTTLVMSIIICLLMTFLRVTENCFWNRIFMLSQIYASIGSFLPQPMKQRSLNYQNLLQLLWKSFLCRLFFQMIEINYVPIYMKINHIFFVINGQFPVTDYISNNSHQFFCRTRIWQNHITFLVVQNTKKHFNT